MAQRIWEARVVEVEGGCGQVRGVGDVFFVSGADECAAACAAGVHILQSKHNVTSPYHDFAVNLSKGVKYFYNYTLLLEEKARARPGVYAS